jgi:hypothetical protein
VPDQNDIPSLREIAKHARELARQLTDEEAVAGLLRYAEQQDAKAAELETVPVLPDASASDTRK